MTAASFQALRKRAGTREAVAKALGVTSRTLRDVETLPEHRHRFLYAFAVQGLLCERERVREIESARRRLEELQNTKP